MLEEISDPTQVAKKDRADEKPRVLFVSVNAFSTTTNNGKTFASFLEGYGAHLVAQLYFTPEPPLPSVANKSYRFTDSQLLRSYTRRKPFDGDIPQAGDETAPPVIANIKHRSNLSKHLRGLRSFLWRRLNLTRGPFWEWVKAFSPQVLVFVGGNANHLYYPVRDLARAMRIPIIYYITDDYVLPRRTLNPLTVRYIRQTRSLFKMMGRESTQVITIGDKMKTVYERTYGIPSITLMNAIEATPVSRSPQPQKPKRTAAMKITYLGGLHFNRDAVLLEIARAISEERTLINSLELHIYSQAAYGAELRDMSEKFPEVLTLHTPVTSSEVMAIQQESDFLLHVESFDRRSREATRLSVSTKIPEYLASGTPVLAVGPKDVASIEYIEETATGSVVTSCDPDSIAAMLKAVTSEPGSVHKMAVRGRGIAHQRHNPSENRRLFWSILRDAGRRRAE